MTNQEAIKQISNAIESYNNLYDEEIDYIKALRLATAALEKQISTGTRREYQHDYMLEWRYCPKCGNPVDSEDGDHYCSRCGQRLKFEEK